MVKINNNHLKLKEFDDNLRKEYGNILCGVDEVGRGSGISIIVAAACILPEDAVIEGLDDSKKLSQTKREELYEKIKEISLSYSIDFRDAPYIDKFGLTKANQIIMYDAAKSTQQQIKQKVNLYIVDQAPKFELDPHLMMSKADSTSLTVAAASVLAKVYRDTFITELSKKYPEYFWDESKGYLNQKHIEAIQKHGLVKNIHRLSYNIKGVDKTFINKKYL